MSPVSKNSSFADIIRQKSLLLHQLRCWFWEKGYLEVQTPIIVSSPAMEETLEAVHCEDHFLHTSPEFAMKHLLAEGLCKIYQIVPCFRAEEEGTHHSREFSMLEWYHVGVGTEALIDETLGLIQSCADALSVQLPPFVRIATSDLLDPNLPEEEWMFTWVDKIEPNLPSGAVVYDYPIWAAALARLRGNVADRFEIYLNGLELANAFHEERDPSIIRNRWEKGNSNRIEQGKEAHPIDHDFLSDIAKMPRCSGIAMGIDRLLMALINIPHITHIHVPNRRDI
jgi:lysyl-tRNA synthetase class 2